MSGFRMSNTNPNKAREESEQLEPTKLIFLFAEGVRTEINYFNQLAKYHSCQDRDLRVFDRWKVNTGHSNQYLLTKNIEEYIEKVNNGKEKEVEMVTQLFEKLQEESLTFEDLTNLYTLMEGLIIDSEELYDQLEAILTIQSFKKGYDEIWIIIDRDYHSFVEKQYDEVLNIAKRNDFKLGVSTPNFEFFLLLHLTPAENIYNSNIFKNGKISNRRRYVDDLLDKELRKLGRFYSKASYKDYEFFFDLFNQGKINSSKYESDIRELKNEVGTSLFNLLSPFFGEKRAD